MEEFTDFLKAKFDNISLFVAMGLLAGMIMHLVHHDSASASLTWAEQTFTTVLGAYIGLTQASKYIQKTNGGNGNGISTNATVSGTSTSTATTTSH